MPPIYSKPKANTSRFTNVEVSLMDLCKDNINSGLIIDVKRLEEKPFEHTSMDQRQLILDEIAHHYNSKVLDGTVLACHLVRGNKVSESIIRWKCSNYKGKCNACIWINKKGQLRDSTDKHKKSCYTCHDAKSSTLQMNGFIQSNIEAYERANYHLQAEPISTSEPDNRQLDFHEVNSRFDSAYNLTASTFEKVKNPLQTA